MSAGAAEVGADGDVKAFLGALGSRVRVLRITRAMTQEELAAGAGMSRSFLSLVEHGATGIDVIRLVRLAGVLGVRLSELIGDLPTPSGLTPEGGNAASTG